MIRFKLDKEKAIAAILYIASALKENNVKPDKHRVFKILYFAERKSIATYAWPITGDRYVAMDKGPVPSWAYDLLKYEEAKDSLRVDGIFIEPLRGPDMDEFSESDLNFINKSIFENQHLSHDELTIKSHGRAWKSAVRNHDMDYCMIAEEDGASSDMCDLIELNAENEQFVESL